MDDALGSLLVEAALKKVSSSPASSCSSSRCLRWVCARCPAALKEVPPSRQRRCLMRRARLRSACVRRFCASPQRRLRSGFGRRPQCGCWTAVRPPLHLCRCNRSNPEARCASGPHHLQRQQNLAHHHLAQRRLLLADLCAVRFSCA